MVNLELLFTLVLCHLVGDYVLQSDFVATTKGSNWYHLIVHSLLYLLPFYICLGWDYALFLLLFSHVYIDAMKARYNQFTYVEDQVLHYFVLFVIFGIIT